jgi:DNA-binding NtrC family response regulator
MSRTRSTTTDLAKLLGDSHAPIYVLDEERRIIYCNAACARWLGKKPAELIGQQCAYYTADENGQPGGIAAGLCPPPKVFSGHAQPALVSCTPPTGQLIYRRGHFFPLGDGQDDSAAVIAILEPYDSLPEDPAAGSDAQLHEQIRRFHHQMAARFRTDSLLGVSPAMARVRAQIELAAATDACVLVLGPQGSGKDHAAKAIHYHRHDPGSLAPLDCAVLEPNLLRATLRALWTKHATAHGLAGTLLLAEVDCMPPEAQADLVEMIRTGSLRLRLIATAVRPLETLVDEGHFSSELACALSTITIQLPSLTARAEDLPLLAQAFLEEVNARGGKQVGGFTSEALDRLAAYNWPGNIDELAAIVRESHERAEAGEVAAKDLPNQIHWAADAASHPARVDETIVLEEFLGRVEKELIARAMHRSKGNKSKAAKLLGLTRPRLYRRLVQLGLAQPGEENED